MILNALCLNFIRQNGARYSYLGKQSIDYNNIHPNDATVKLLRIIDNAILLFVPFKKYRDSSFHKWYDRELIHLSRMKDSLYVKSFNKAHSDEKFVTAFKECEHKLNTLEKKKRHLYYHKLGLKFMENTAMAIKSF